MGGTATDVIPHDYCKIIVSETCRKKINYYYIIIIIINGNQGQIVMDFELQQTLN